MRREREKASFSLTASCHVVVNLQCCPLNCCKYMLVRATTVLRVKLPPSATLTPRLDRPYAGQLAYCLIGFRRCTLLQRSGQRRQGKRTPCRHLVQPLRTPSFARFPGQVGRSSLGFPNASSPISQLLEGLDSGLPERSGRIEVSRLPERRLGVLDFARARQNEPQLVVRRPQGRLKLDRHPQSLLGFRVLLDLGVRSSEVVVPDIGSWIDGHRERLSIGGDSLLVAPLLCVGQPQVVHGLGIARIEFHTLLKLDFSLGGLSKIEEHDSERIVRRG